MPILAGTDSNDIQFAAREDETIGRELRSETTHPRPCVPSAMSVLQKDLPAALPIECSWWTLKPTVTATVSGAMAA